MKFVVISLTNGQRFYTNYAAIDDVPESVVYGIGWTSVTMINGKNAQIASGEIAAIYEMDSEDLNNGEV